jgi:uncharacterized repeat protein (TIGR03803 family)
MDAKKFDTKTFNLVKIMKPPTYVILAICAGLSAAGIARAQDISTVYNFSIPNGVQPYAALKPGPDGCLYGTTTVGGTNSSPDYGTYGTIFKVTTNGAFTTLVNFNGANGAFPTVLTPGPDGNFYGTTGNGGYTNLNSGFGYGTVFKMTPGGALTTLAEFNGTNGAGPYGGVTLGPDGNFYGTTEHGGTAFSSPSELNPNGSIFKMSPDGNLTRINIFDPNGSNGGEPVAALAVGPDGNLYGTCHGGVISGCCEVWGSVFRVTTNGDLFVFFVRKSSADTNGTTIDAGLTLGPDGSFYGVAGYGGENGNGVVFKFTTNGTYTPLYNFDGTNGAHPSGDLIFGPDRCLYGTTFQGGSTNQNSYYGTGFGTVFKMTTNGELTTLASFNQTNGAFSRAGLALGPDGNFYGTTSQGGSGGGGTIFRLNLPPDFATSPANQTLAVGGTATFSCQPFGTAPFAYQWLSNGVPIPGATNPVFVITNVQVSSSGSRYCCVVTNLYGAMTSSAASLGVCGMSTVHYFTGYDGCSPSGKLIQTADGTLHGTTTRGGAFADNGTVFSISSNLVFQSVSSLDGVNGAHPLAGLAQGLDGCLYTATYAGGNNNSGAILRADSGGNLSLLHSFNGAEAGGPDSDLLPWPDGSFYGTTYAGGASSQGTVFNIATNGQLTEVFSFDIAHGAIPMGGLVSGPDGCLYGAANSGGAFNSGAVYKITTNGAPSVIHSFNSSDGANPSGGVLFGQDGCIYGTTKQGGSQNMGAVYRLSTNGAFTNLVMFNGANGAYPVDALIQSPKGVIYGTTQYGGAYGDGTVFQLDANGNLSTILSFAGTNGSVPQASLLLGTDGNLYGVTAYGGSGYSGSANTGNGTVFSLTLPRSAPPVITSLAILPNNGIQLTISGDPGDTFHVLASSDLQTWQTIGPLTNLGGPVCFQDCAATNFPCRFYRLVSP